MRRLVTHLLVAALAFCVGVAANVAQERLATADETMPPAPQYELAAPLPTERVCEAHGVRMRVEQVPLHGPIDEEQVPVAISPEEFSHHFPHNGSGVTTLNSDIVDGQTVSVYVCPVCRAAWAAWWKKHRAEVCTC